jgi:hypothetical protein
VDERGINFLLAVVKGVEPKDQLEAMLAAQMAAVHMSTMTFARAASHMWKTSRNRTARSGLSINSLEPSRHRWRHSSDTELVEIAALPGCSGTAKPETWARRAPDNAELILIKTHLSHRLASNDCRHASGTLSNSASLNDTNLS